MNQRLIDPPRLTSTPIHVTPKAFPQRSPFPRDIELSQKAHQEPSDTNATVQSGDVSPTRHIPVLDAWRGTALVLLYLGHFFPIYHWDFGAFGVEFFFVLSGFLMGGILFVRKAPLKTFYQRRISRILPAAYVFLSAMLVWQLLATTDGVPSLSSISACFLFYVNYFVASDPKIELGIPAAHFWSLCVEEHCYIYLSLLAVFHRRLRLHPLLLIGGSILLCFASARIFGRETNWNSYQFYFRSDCRAASILMGAAAAYLVTMGVGNRKSYFGVPTIGWGFLAVCWATYFRLHTMSEFTKYTAGTGLLAVGLLLIAQHAKSRIWAFPPLIWIGTASFSLYLWQQPFYIAVRKGQMATRYAVVAAILAGVISYFLIEKPARKWINHRWG